MKQGAKSTFSLIFLFLAIILMLLPFLTTFSELLTAIFLKIGWFRVIQEYLVPFEIRMIVVVMQFLGQTVEASKTTLSVLRPEGNWQKIYVSWNCIGWQSLLVLAVTLYSGLHGPFTKSSKLECLIFGVVGTFLVNIIRVSLIAIMFVYFNSVPAMVIHDYSSVIVLILWMFFFWWFSYSYVLEEENNSSN